MDLGLDATQQGNVAGTGFSAAAVVGASNTCERKSC